MYKTPFSALSLIFSMVALILAVARLADRAIWFTIPNYCFTLIYIRKSHLDLEHFRELQYFQRSHGALGASGCLSKMDIFLGVFGYLSEMAQRCIFTWVSLDIFERSLKHLSKIFQRCIVPWVSPGGFQISFRHVYLLECL